MRRLHYLDNLRILLSVLVVLHHVGIGYGSMGDWCYVTNDPIQGVLQKSLSALFGIEAFFSMSLFFFISAYLTPYSLDKKSAKEFIRKQMLRLVIPLLFVMVIFAPSVLYFVEIYRQTTELSWFNYVLHQNIYAPTTSHAWFILVLIIFEAVYVLYWTYIRPKYSISKHIRNNTPSHTQIAIVIFLCSFLTILLRQYYPIGKNTIGLQIANFIPYIIMYALGILVSRKNWLDSLSDRISKTWFLVSLPVIAIFSYLMFMVIKNPPMITKFVEGIHPESISLAFIDTIICFGLSGFFIKLFREKFDYSNSILSKMTANRYGVYIFHSIVVVGITMLLEFVELQPAVRFIVASFFSVLISFLFVGLIRKFKPVSKII